MDFHSMELKVFLSELSDQTLTSASHREIGDASQAVGGKESTDCVTVANLGKIKFCNISLKTCSQRLKRLNFKAKPEMKYVNGIRNCRNSSTRESELFLL